MVSKELEVIGIRKYKRHREIFFSVSFCYVKSEATLH